MIHVMALTLQHLSRSANLFVANQLRICARYKMKHIHSRCHNYLLPWGHTGNPAFISRRRRCAIYQHSLTGFRRYIQNFKNTMPNHNLPKFQVRYSHTGKRSDFYVGSAPMVTKTHKTRKPLPNCKSSRSSVDCTQKDFIKDRLKICRPRLVSSSASKLNSDFKMLRLLKTMREKSYPINSTKNRSSDINAFDRKMDEARHTQTKAVKNDQSACDKNSQCAGCDNISNKNGECLNAKTLKHQKSFDENSLKITTVNGDLFKSVSNAAKEMTEWMNAVVRKHLNNFEEIERLDRKYNNLLNEKVNDGRKSPYKSTTKVNIASPSKNTTVPKTRDALDISGQISTNLTEKNRNLLPFGQLSSANSNIGKNLDKINPEINQIKKKVSTDNDSTRPIQDRHSETYKGSGEIIEIRPAYIENVQMDLNAGISKKKKDVILPINASVHAAASQAVSTIAIDKRKAMEDHQGFILVDHISNQLTRNNSVPRLSDSGRCNEKGFILVGNDETTLKTTSQSHVRPEEKRFVMVDDKSENVIRRSKQEKKNYVLVNDNLLNNLKNTGTKVTENSTSHANTCTQCVTGISMQSSQDQLGTFGDGPPGCVQLETSKEKPGHSTAANQNQSLMIGTSDSYEELQHSENNPTHVKKYSPLMATQWGKKNASKDSPPLNFELQKLSKVLADANESRKFEDSLKADQSTWTTKGDQRKWTMKGDQSKWRTKGDQSKSITKVAGNLKGNGQEKSVLAKNSAGHTIPLEEVTKLQMSYTKEAAIDKRSTDDKAVKTSSPPAECNRHEQPKISPNEVQAKTSIRKSSSADNLNKSNMNVSNGNISYRNMHKENAPIKPAELKPDFRNKDTKRCSSCSNVNVAKATAEPQLFVKPEELSKKTKKGNGIKTDTSTHAPKLFTAIAGLDKAKSDTKPMLRWKDNSANIQQNNSNHASNTAPDSDRFNKLNESISLPDLFLKMRQRTSKEEAIQNKYDTQSTKYDTQSTKYDTHSTKKDKSSHNSRRNNEVIRSLREQWLKDLKKKNANLGQTSSYLPYYEKNANCLVGKPQDYNTSSGQSLETVVITQATESKAVPISPQESIIQKTYKRSERLPAMGMAERLLAASKTTITATEGSDVRITDSSMTIVSDSKSVQGLTENADFPEINKFEEWVQTNIPKYNDVKSTLSQSINQEMKTYMNIPVNNTATASMDKSRYEGSEVDSPSFLRKMNKRIDHNVIEVPPSENKQLQDLPSTVKSTADQQLLQDTQSVSYEEFSKTNNTFKKDGHNNISRTVTDSLMKDEVPLDVARNIPGISRKLQSDTGVLDIADSSINVDKKIDVPSTMNAKDQLMTGFISKLANMNKSKLMSSMDGFVSMRLINEIPNPFTKTLKPTLKRSQSRERSEDKKVSFLAKASRNDNCRVEDNIDWAIDDVRESNRYVGLRPSRCDSVTTGKGSGERDLRKELEIKRKRAAMDASIKLITETTKQIREYETVLSKYRNIIGKLKDDKL